ncbi:hypothetical protein CH352_00950 [Leptospira hartskeerlii]|uniref:Uncharacterized protein n=1 Tax=Leptospira hartskeerlii TaxID=2023177 RepID=A0A2M9X8U6_9LEPT|nr:hypothetical protein [Leptospira hartskeerlii]PJZ23972.1 hypothetical protein CH357_18530 [Leptospira hartskeerlii]PJZ35236.1 hypothetical protein CH352_00950 [Leptospira hartskeerlii]
MKIPSWLLIPLIAVGYLVILGFYFYSINCFGFDFNDFSKLITNLTGYSVLIVGYYYYQNKKEIDNENRTKDLHDKALRHTIENFSEYEKAINSILGKSFKNEKELINLRHSIICTWDTIEALLNKEDIKLEDGKIKLIIQLHSFIEKSDTIMRAKPSKLTKSELNVLIEVYFDKLRAAKKALF